VHAGQIASLPKRSPEPGAIGIAARHEELPPQPSRRTRSIAIPFIANVLVARAQHRHRQQRRLQALPIPFA
jgi:hypothetical protein